jgi:hypothetical protein
VSPANAHGASVNYDGDELVTVVDIPLVDLNGDGLFAVNFYDIISGLVVLFQELEEMLHAKIGDVYWCGHYRRDEPCLRMGNVRVAQLLSVLSGVKE